MRTSSYKSALHPPRVVTPPDMLNEDKSPVYALDKWSRLRRVLLIGSDSGTYYVNAEKNANRGLATVRECLADDPTRTMSEAIQISVSGRAVKNDHAIWVLATAALYDYGDEEKNKRYRSMAYASAQNVCRTFTHLATFIDLRGGIPGAGMKRFVARWFTYQSATNLAYGAIKYKKRKGWGQRDAIILATPKPTTHEQSEIFKYILSGEANFEARRDSTNLAFSMIEAAESLNSDSATELDAISAIRRFSLPHEAIPDRFLKSPAVWREMLVRMPYMAMIRNLGRMAVCGTFDPETIKMICAKIRSEDDIRYSLVHPLSILIAARQFKAGHGLRGHLTWKPNSYVLNALDEAFSTAFGNVHSTGKNILLAIDTSASMVTPVGEYGITAREVAAAMAIVTSRVEPNAKIIGFSGSIQKLSGIDGMRLDDLLLTIARIPAQNTFCVLPIDYATVNLNSWSPDAIVMYTDGQTQDKGSTVASAMQRIRRQANKPDMKQVIVAMTATDFSLADPNDVYAIDIAGFDTGVPQFVSGFIGD